METKKYKPKRVSRLFWISVTINAVFLVAAWGIATNRMAVSWEPMQIVSSQPQVLPAKLPVTAATVFGE